MAFCLFIQHCTSVCISSGSEVERGRERKAEKLGNERGKEDGAEFWTNEIYRINQSNLH